MNQYYYQQFKKLPWEIKSVIDNNETKEEIKKLEEKYDLDFLSIIFMIVVKDLLLDDLQDYFVDKYNKNSQEALNIKNDLEKYIFEPILDYLYENDLDKDKEIKKIRLVFKENLFEIIDLYTDKQLKRLNAKIISLLWGSDNFQDNLLRDLLDNEEKITSQKITINNKTEAPAIGNWLGNFIKEMGSSKADSLTISKYLTHSDNAGKISEAEKEKLKQLLSIYSNLKFFPINMNDVPVENWEIIPIKKEEKMKKARLAEDKTTKITPQERQQYKQEKVEKLKTEFSDELEKKAIEEEILGNVQDENIQIRKKELQEMMKQYKIGSLERRAVEEEVEKL